MRRTPEHVPLRPTDPRALGPYRLLGRLGAGGMGEVYLGRGPGGRYAAVKLVHDVHAADPAFRARFAREIEIASSVRIPWSARVLDADAASDVPWLATEYIAGPTLEAAVGASGALPERSVAVLVAALAQALAALHAAGVVHRDVKPSNVLLAEDGPHLIDFGIAHALDAANLTQADAIVGAPGFMSPEQALGERSGPASDVFSLAAVAVHAVTGRLPFGTVQHPLALLRRIVDEPADLSGVPAGLTRLLAPCLAKAPGDRPTAADLAAAFGPLLPPPAGWLPERVHGPGMPPRRPNRRTFLLGAAGLVATGAGIGAAVAGRSAHPAAVSAPSAVPSAWSYSSAARTPVTRVSAAGGTLLVDSADRVDALDLRTGQQRWNAQIPISPLDPSYRGGWARGSAVVGDTYYAHDSGGVFALDVGTGRRQWEQTGARFAAASTAVVLGITAGTATTWGLVGIDPGTGATLWTAPGPPMQEQGERFVNMEVAVDGGRVHTAWPTSLQARDARTGRLVWAQTVEIVSGMWTSPVGLLVAAEREFQLLDAATGRRIRSYAAAGYAWGSTARAIGQDLHLTATGREIAVWDAATGRNRWRAGLAGGSDAAVLDVEPAVLDGVVYVAEMREHRQLSSIVGRDVRDGTVRSQLATDARNYAYGDNVVAAAGDTLCLLSQTGVRAYRP